MSKKILESLNVDIYFFFNPLEKNWTKCTSRWRVCYQWGLVFVFKLIVMFIKSYIYDTTPKFNTINTILFIKDFMTRSGEEYMKNNWLKYIGFEVLS